MVYNFVCVIFTFGGSDNVDILLEEIGEYKDYFEFCDKCNSSRPIGSHHCRRCKKCILKMDHHCVWITNCVGLCNQKYFIQFLVYMELMCIFNLLLIVGNVMDLLDKNDNLDSYIFKRDALYFIFINFLISVIFFLFVCIILIGQIYSIIKGNSKIDELKKIKFKRITVKENLKIIFGNSFAQILLPVKNKMYNYNDELKFETIIDMINNKHLEITTP
uniref:Palmitoyltransferase n=1 Tax=Theileria annulata TaxID=5874 RepID=A0A3B0MMA2_THEAN